MDDTPTIIVIAVLTIYLIVLVVRDWRRKDYLWFALSAAAAIAMLVIPQTTQTITIDLPASK